MALRNTIFRDEVVWRGHMLAFSYVIRVTLHEIAAWAAGVLFVYLLLPKFTWVAALVVAARMSYAYVQDWLRVQSRRERHLRCRRAQNVRIELSNHQ